METFNTYCVSCDEEVAANIEYRNSVVRVKGDDVGIGECVAVCPHCGSDIADSRIESGNLSRAYEAYSRNHGIVTQNEAREIRRRFGLSVREFSRFLGFGEQTYARYESGSIPTKSHSDLIRLATTPEGAKSLLNSNADRITPDSRNKVNRAIAEMTSSDQGCGLRILFDFLMPDSGSPSNDNGYREFSPERASALVSVLASNCRNLYRTKLQKAMFLCDFLACERTGKSITGLKYAHANYGPVMRDGDFLLAQLKRDGVVEIIEDDRGEILKACAPAACVFSQDELDVIDDVVKCVNSFSTASALSNYSHGLACWSETSSGEIIGYNYRFGEVGKAVERRLASS